MVDLDVFCPGNLFNAVPDPGTGVLDHIQTLISLGDVPFRHLDNCEGIADVVVKIPDLLKAPLKAFVTGVEQYPDEDGEERAFNRIFEQPILKPRQFQQSY